MFLKVIKISDLVKVSAGFTLGVIACLFGPSTCQTVKQIAENKQMVTTTPVELDVSAEIPPPPEIQLAASPKTIKSATQPVPAEKTTAISKVKIENTYHQLVEQITVLYDNLSDGATFYKDVYAQTLAEIKKYPSLPNNFLQDEFINELLNDSQETIMKSVPQASYERTYSQWAELIRDLDTINQFYKQQKEAYIKKKQ